ncbi:hypothetical protein [Rhodococcus opacus]|uniref:hypothetical protein n=1 Tax=Rhodococcus opacus TaxID=37919 RepID=UPI0034D1CA9D
MRQVDGGFGFGLAFGGMIGLNRALTAPIQKRLIELFHKTRAGRSCVLVAKHRPSI